MASEVVRESLGSAAAHDMSALGLFMEADIVVKLVMMALLFCFCLELGDYFAKT